MTNVLNYLKLQKIDIVTVGALLCLIKVNHILISITADPDVQRGESEGDAWRDHYFMLRACPEAKGRGRIH
jgi:hypothetical protein